MGHARRRVECRPTIGRTTLTLLATVIAFLVLGKLFPEPARAGSVGWPNEVDEVYTVYVATPQTGGSDENSGLSRTDPVASMQGVQRVLQRGRPGTDVEVRIGPGTYAQPPLDAWRVYIPGHTISFLPWNYNIGEAAIDDSERPVFRNTRCPQDAEADASTERDGEFCEGSWFTARPPTEPSHAFYTGGDSGLRFYYLTIERYSAGGISIRGDSERDVQNEKYDPPLRTPGVSLDRNVFQGLVIREIGNKWTGGHYGWGGIVLTGSSDNQIVDNTFERIENRKSHEGYIHGVYVTHFSSHNRIRGNTFETISGDPVKVRDRSDHNIFDGNEFIDAGALSYFRAEFCGKACAIEHNKAQECPSVGNRFAGNLLRGGYQGREIDLFSYSSGSYPTTEASACGPPSQKQLRTEGNKTGK